MPAFFRDTRLDLNIRGFTLNYRIISGIFRTFCLRTRYGFLIQWGKGAKETQEIRITLNWLIGLL